eukprot:200216-Rhodomonas_salina.7
MEIISPDDKCRFDVIPSTKLSEDKDEVLASRNNERMVPGDAHTQSERVPSIDANQHTIYEKGLRRLFAIPGLRAVHDLVAVWASFSGARCAVICCDHSCWGGVSVVCAGCHQFRISLAFLHQRLHLEQRSQEQASLPNSSSESESWLVRRSLHRKRGQEIPNGLCNEKSRFGVGPSAFLCIRAVSQ